MQPETVPALLERFGLRIGEPLSGRLETVNQSPPTAAPGR
jgi:hypothetical protein